MKAVLRFAIFVYLFQISSSLFAQESKIPFALTHRSGKIMETAKSVSFLVKGDADQIAVAIKNLGGTFRYSIKDISSVSLPANQIAAFVQNEFVEQVEYSGAKGQTLNDSALVNANVIPVHNGQSPLTQSYHGDGVVVGIIDAGIDFTHPDFQKSNGDTRIQFLWDQNVTNPNNPPSPYGYGDEWTASDIDNNLCTHVEYPAELGHGSNVAGVAVGDGSAVGLNKGIATQADIIVVSVGYNNNFMTNFVDACDYIFSRADAMGKPCIINSSVGSYVGSHDARDLHAQLVDALLDQTGGRVLTQAAGNERTTKFHLGYDVSPVDTQFTWFLYNAGFGDAYFQIWADQYAWDNVNFAMGCYEVSSTSDLGRSPFWNILDDFNLVDGGSGQLLNYNLLDGSNNLLGEINVFAQLIDSLYSVEIQVLPANSANYWSLETIGSGHLDVWSKPSLTSSSTMIKPPLLPDSIQYPRIVNYAIPDTFMTIVSSWPCSEKVITVANYVNRNGYYDVDSIYRTYPETHENIAVSSSTGPTRDYRQKPDITASGQGCMTTGNMDVIAVYLGNSNRSKVGWGGMHNSNGGTSMAAPIVAGVCALYLEKNPTATWQEIKSALEQTARQDSYTGTNIPNWSWGYGKVDAFNAMTQASFIYGCTDSTAFNYDPNANIDDGSCVPFIYGCTDSTAFNFDPLANTDDGSCIPVIYGCTDSSANNYNALANTDDGSCVYDTVGIFTVEPINSLIHIFPNPTDQWAVISWLLAGNENSMLKIFNSLGQEVFSELLETSNLELQTSNWPAGVYYCVLKNDSYQLPPAKLVIY